MAGYYTIVVCAAASADVPPPEPEKQPFRGILAGPYLTVPSPRKPALRVFDEEEPFDGGPVS